VLRPELVSGYNKPIKADLKKKIPGQLLKNDYHINVKDSEEIQDLEDLAHLSQYLQQEVIPVLVKEFDDLKTIPVSSRQLESIFHSYGINMRYLGYVASIASQHHIKVICICNMIARTAKNIFNEQVARQILQESDATTSRASERSDGAGYSQEEYFDIKSRKWIIDFLNLFLGKSEEKEEFWHEVLLPRVAQYFNYLLEDLHVTELQGNALYFSFLDLTGVKESSIYKPSDWSSMLEFYHNN